MTTQPFIIPVSAPALSRRLLLVLGVLTLIGAGLAAASTLHFYAFKNGTAGFKSFCSINATIDCDRITASRYAEILPGLPLASLACGWLSAQLLIVALSFLADWSRSGRWTLLFMTAVGSLTSLVYLGVMIGALHALCLSCLGIDLVNWLSFGLLWRAHPRMTGAPSRLQLLLHGGVMVAMMAVVGGSLRALDRVGLSVEEIRTQANQILAQTPRVPPDPSDATLSTRLGNPRAPIVIHEFSDFQCPVCKLGAQELHALQKRYPDQVQIIVRNYPLDHSCNMHLQQTMHPAACEAARVSLCAAAQHRYPLVYERLFELQETFTRSSPRQLAQGADFGLDWPSFKDCEYSSAVLVSIREDIEIGRRMDVVATPTFFISGYKIEGLRPAPVLEAVVSALLSRQGT